MCSRNLFAVREVTFLDFALNVGFSRVLVTGQLALESVLSGLKTVLHPHHCSNGGNLHLAAMTRLQSLLV